jgi:hypothetical protein
VNWWDVGGAALTGAFVGGTLGYGAEALGLFGAADASAAAADAGTGAAADTVGDTSTAATADSPPAQTETLPQEGGCSFTPDTPVITDHGQQAIGTVHQGEKVEAYNPQTHKMETQPIAHVWVHPDDDLVDLTITYQSSANQSSSPQAKTATQRNASVHKEKPSHAINEVVHTNKMSLPRFRRVSSGWN